MIIEGIIKKLFSIKSCLEFNIKTKTFKDNKSVSETTYPYQYLNEFYAEQGLQFDEYGNPIYLESNH
jgi:hypothetical protein